MNWNETKRLLSEGKQVKGRPKGNSMSPRIESGQLITIDPDVRSIEVGDIVFCKVNGSHYVHLVKAIGSDGRMKIGNNHGRINGWTRAVYGKVISVSD